MWTKKKETDDCYNACVRVLINAVRQDLDQSRAGYKAVESALVIDASMVKKKKGWLDFMWRRDNAEAVLTSAKETVRTTVPGIGVLFGTHNWDSCALILKELVGNGLAVEVNGSEILSGEVQSAIQVGDEVVERVAIGQLYGMFADFIVITLLAPLTILMQV